MITHYITYLIIPFWYSLNTTLETTDLELADIAPRIKKLNSEIKDLETEKNKLEARLNAKEIPELSEEDIKPYVDDLQDTLKLGSTAEQKSFIRSFVEKIWIDFPTATIEYTLPLNKIDDSNKEVLVFDRCGWPLWTMLKPRFYC